MREISIQLNPSFSVVILLAVFTFYGIFSVGYTVLMMPIKIGLSFVILGYVGYLIWQYGLLMSSTAIQRFTLETDMKKATISQVKGKFAAELLGDSTITRYFCILRFFIPSQNKKYTCLVARDALHPDVYRQLFVFLQYVH